MTAMPAILVGAAIGIGLNVAVYVSALLYFRSKRRRHIARSLADFDREFGSLA